MDKSKGVHKYSIPAYVFRCFLFNLHLMVLPPLLLLTVAVLFVSGMAVLILITATVFILLSGNPPALDVPIGFLFAGLLASLAVAFGCGWFVRCTFTAPEGHLLNPRWPEENVLLPDAELLVRASSSSAAQPAELLRAAQETTEQTPEELLRAAQ